MHHELYVTSVLGNLGSASAEMVGQERGWLSILGYGCFWTWL